MEWFGLKGTLKLISFYFPAVGGDTLHWTKSSTMRVGERERKEGDYVPFQSQTGGPTTLEVKTPPPSPLELIIPVIFNQHSLQKVGRTTDEKIKLIYTSNQEQAVQNTQIWGGNNNKYWCKS